MHLWRYLQAVLLFAAGVLAVAPVALPPRTWRFTVEHRWLGFTLLACVALAYARRWWRWRESGRPPNGLALTGLDVTLLVALPVYVFALANGRIHTSGDNAATRLLGTLIVREHTLDLSRLPYYQGEPLHYSAVRVGNRILPAYPVGTAVLSVPYAALASAATSGEPPSDREVNRWEKHLSAIIASAASAFLFLAFRRVCSEAAAAGATLVFAFATTAFSSISQALWSTTGEVFFISLALWVLTVPDGIPRGRFLAGVALGVAFLCRPTAVVAAGAIGVCLFLRRRSDVPAYAAGFGLSTAAIGWFLYGLYGHPLGSYALMHRAAWGHHVTEGLLGNLLSPSRGLLVFCPYLLLCPLAWPGRPTTAALRPWLSGTWCALAGYCALVAAFDHWAGGWSIGPRLMTEATPFIALVTVPVWLQLRMRSILGGAFVVAVTFAVATQSLAVYSDRAERANATLTDAAAFWTLRRSQIAAIWCLPCEIDGHTTKPVTIPPAPGPQQ